MSESARFADLWNDYLEGELDEAGVTELRNMLAADERLIKIATDTFQTHRLLGLAAQESRTRHDDFVRETLERLPSQGDRFVGSVMQQVRRESAGVISNPRVRWTAWRLTWMAAAAAVVVSASGLFAVRKRTEPRIARVAGLNGSVQWTGDAGKVERELAAGRSLGGGTLESLSADSWAELEFRDGSKVTVTGRSLLTVSEHRQKELHLRIGKLSASVTPQPLDKPMLIHTLTAELEVLGTQFNVDAGMSSTVLWVNEGKVRVKRLADGSVAEVAAGHQVVAAASRQNDFRVAPRPGSVTAWRSNLPNGVTYGNWAPDTAGLRASSMLWRDCEKKDSEPILLYVAALSVSRGDGPPVELRAGATFRIRGRMDSASDVLVGLTTQHLNGGFAGKHHAFRKAELFSSSGGAFELEVKVDEFTPEKPNHPKSAIGLGLYDWWCLTINEDAGLTITSVELIPATPAQE